MATSYIYRFAENATGANILSDSAYDSDSQRTIGHQPGLARQELENKALKSVSAIAAAVAQFTADNQASDVTDSLTTAQLVSLLTAALDSNIASRFTGGNQDLTAAQNNGASSGEQILPGGLILKWGGTAQYQSAGANTFNTVNVVLPTAFPTKALAPFACPSSIGVSSGYQFSFAIGGFDQNGMTITWTTAGSSTGYYESFFWLMLGV